MGWGQHNEQNSGIAHRWAHQLPNPKKRGEYAGTLIEHNTGRNFYRDGMTIYSYGPHFPIASLHRKKGKKDFTVLFTLREYSNTTSSHKGIVSGAVSHLDKIYCLYPDSAARNIHSDNLRNWEKQAETQYNSITERTRKPEMYFSAIASLREELQKYCKYFGLTKKNNAALASLQYVWMKPSKKLISEAMIRAEKEREREAEKVAKKELKAKQQAELHEKISPIIIAQWHKFQPYITQGLPEEGVEKGTWVNIPRDLFHWVMLNGKTLLRANTNTKNIETSKGIDIPFDVAQRAYKWLKHKLTTGGCSGECEYKILGYEVSRVNNEGFVIGCHDIEWNEADTLAKQLGWI